MEPTQPVPHYPEFNEPTYLQPPPPPPSPSKHQRDIILALTLLCIVLVIALPFTAYFVLYRPTSHATLTPTPSPTVSRATPTLDPRVGILTNDFPRFLASFSTLLTQRDYTDIQGIIDTENFQEIALGISEGPGNWAGLYQALTSGQETLSISSPPLDPGQVDNCQGYGPTSFEGYSVDALALQYVVGTTTLADTSSVPQRPQNDDVFVFELPFGPSEYWTWRALTENNTIAPC